MSITSMIVTLLVAIKAVESTNGLDLNAHGNNYQITQVCVQDVNRIYKTKYRWPRDVRNEEMARDIARLYLSYYGSVYFKEYGRAPTKAVLARIYHRGYDGFKRGEGREYAQKVLRIDAKKNQRRKRK